MPVVVIRNGEVIVEVIIQVLVIRMVPDIADVTPAPAVQVDGQVEQWRQRQQQPGETVDGLLCYDVCKRQV